MMTMKNEMKQKFSLGQRVRAHLSGKSVEGWIENIYQHDFTREDTIFVRIQTVDKGHIFVHPSRVEIAADHLPLSAA